MTVSIALPKGRLGSKFVKLAAQPAFGQRDNYRHFATPCTVG